MDGNHLPCRETVIIDQPFAACIADTDHLPRTDGPEEPEKAFPVPPQSEPRDESKVAPAGLWGKGFGVQLFEREVVAEAITCGNVDFPASQPEIPP